MRKLSVFAAIVIAVGLALPCVASINNGDEVRLTDGFGNGPGGAFNVQDLTAPYASNFVTFCLEKNENVSIPGNYYVSVETSAIFGGVGVADIGGKGTAGVLNSYDPLSPLTAWLYTNALAGTLTGYTASSNNDNDALQDAIWYIENEISSLATGSLAKTFYDAAVTANPSDIGNVRVMNLWATAADAASHNSAGKRQSMLVMVPEASTIAVWSVLSLVGAGVAYRKRTAKA
jgi:hypothetical protein